jgi:hypothetical protein
VKSSYSLGSVGYNTSQVRLQVLSDRQLEIETAMSAKADKKRAPVDEQTFRISLPGMITESASKVLSAVDIDLQDDNGTIDRLGLALEEFEQASHRHDTFDDAPPRRGRESLIRQTLMLFKTFTSKNTTSKFTESNMAAVMNFASGIPLPGPGPVVTTAPKTHPSYCDPTVDKLHEAFQNDLQRVGINPRDIVKVSGRLVDQLLLIYNYPPQNNRQSQRYGPTAISGNPCTTRHATKSGLDRDTL